MALLSVAKRVMLQSLAGPLGPSDRPISSVSLHSAWPETDGKFELSGSGYARQAVTWGAIVNDVLSQGAQPLFSVPAATIAWVGAWDSVGTFMGPFPLGGGAFYHAVVIDETTDLVNAPGHPFVDGDSVVVWGDFATEGTTYWVRDKTTHTLKLALTQGGAVTNVDTGGGYLQKITPQVYAAAGQFRLNALDISMNLAG